MAIFTITFIVVDDLPPKPTAPLVGEGATRLPHRRTTTHLYCGTLVLTSTS
jgi:hypothetical protein